MGPDAGVKLSLVPLLVPETSGNCVIVADARTVLKLSTLSTIVSGTQ